MRKGKMKNSIVTIAMAMMLSVTAVVGFGTNAKAKNASDRWYSFSNVNVSGDCAWQVKEDTSKVYVHPVSGPAIYYTVQGLSDGKTYKASDKHVIPTGSKASITNHVFEWRSDTKNNPSARLHMERKSVQPVDTSGYWSPDSIGTYTIYG